jgi:hypothetical protein
VTGVHVGSTENRGMVGNGGWHGNDPQSGRDEAESERCAGAESRWLGASAHLTIPGWTVQMGRGQLTDLSNQGFSTLIQMLQL